MNETDVVLQQLNPLKDVEVFDVDCCSPFVCRCCGTTDVHVGLISFSAYFVEIPIICNACGEDFTINYQNILIP